MKDITFPENAITKDFVEILYNENEKEIRLYFPKEAMIIREIVKEAQFKFDWVALCWYTKITIRCPSVEDRMAEIANFLLNKGIPIYLKDKEIINKAITGNYEPSIKRIICKNADNNKFRIYFERNDQLYNFIKKIPTARYDYSKFAGSFFEVDSYYYESIRDLVNLYNFKLTIGAKELIEEAEKEYIERTKIRPVKKEEKVIDNIKSNDILLDLIDED